MPSPGGEPWTNPPRPEPEQTPKWEAPLWGKAPSKDQNPAYARWRIGGSTRGSDAPPWSAGEPRTGGSAEVGRQS